MKKIKNLSGMTEIELEKDKTGTASWFTWQIPIFLKAKQFRTSFQKWFSKKFKIIDDYHDDNCSYFCISTSSGQKQYFKLSVKSINPKKVFVDSHKTQTLDTII